MHLHEEIYLYNVTGYTEMINPKKNTHINKCTIFVKVNNTIIFIRTNYSQLPLINIFRT